MQEAYPPPCIKYSCDVPSWVEVMGYCYPVLAREYPYVVLAGGVLPSCLGWGLPPSTHSLGVPIQSWLVTTYIQSLLKCSPILTWSGYPPSEPDGVSISGADGVPPRTWLGYPPRDTGPGTGVPPQKGMRPVYGKIMGWRWGHPLCEQTDRQKGVNTLSSPFLRNAGGNNVNHVYIILVTSFIQYGMKMWSYFCYILLLIKTNPTY